MFKLKEHAKRVFYTTLGVIILIILYAFKNTGYFMRAVTFALAMFLFFIIDYYFNFKFDDTHYGIFIIVSITGILLSPFYYIYPEYDKVLHLVNPILLSVIIFFLINKVKIKFSTKLMITCAFVITFLALFEIGEFTMDKLFDLKLQGVYLRDYTGIEKLKIIQDPNDDTMIDLILGAIGSLIFAGIKVSALGYDKYLKDRTKFLLPEQGSSLPLPSRKHL